MQARLSRHPEASVRDIASLVAVARAVEDEAERRYRWLAEEMRRRGEAATADTFERLAAEEASHIGAVTEWASGLGAPPDAAAGGLAWRLSPDLAATWDEMAGSALLTPYRALALAVDNEMRAFAFYAYLAAEAADPRVAREAERLAVEELRHAALLRTWRRAAWRDMRHDPAPPTPTDRAALDAMVAAAERRTALCHRALAVRATAAGDTAGARLLEQLATEAERGSADGPEAAAGIAPSGSAGDPIAIFHAALKPLERLADDLEQVMLDAPDEATRSHAEATHRAVVARLAKVGRHLDALSAPGA